MPRGNGTGPNGMGPMTGRGAGYCAGFAAPGYANGGGFGAGFGGGFGCRAGLGRGYRRMANPAGMAGWVRNDYGPYAPQAPVDEKVILQNQANYLASQLEQINQRLSGLNETEE